MKKMMVFVFLVLCAGPVQAAVVNLNSGVRVEGEILERSADSIKIDIGGVSVTYFKDEIKSIDGDAAAVELLGLNAPEQVPAAVAAAPVEEGTPVLQTKPAEEQQVLSGELTEEKKVLIRKFVEAFGTRASMTANFQQMIQRVPPDQAEQLKVILNVDAVIEELLPVYHKYFTEADLQAYIAFFESIPGRKLVNSIPWLMQESVAVSSKYFEKTMPETLRNARLGNPQPRP